MFLTTVRVRRARRKTLQSLDVDVPAKADVSEVLVHGQVVAVVDLTPRTGRTLWQHPDLKGTAQSSVDRLARNAAALSAVAKECGLCETVEREAA